MAVQLRTLDHVTVRTGDLDASLAFYREVLGLEIADWRPPFSFDGAWLALAGHAVVHLVAGRAVADPEGAVDHFRNRRRGLPGNRQSRADGQKHHLRRARKLRTDAFRQLFVRDPDGVKIEIVFDQQRPVA